MLNQELYGGVEAGGTKFVCGLGSSKGELIARAEFLTTTPDETIGHVIDFFKSQQKVKAIGIGSFGPLNLDQRSDRYGMILNTPKPGWTGINILNTVSQQINTKVNIATDTDVAVLGEYYYGIGLNIDDLVYLTVGTGIGGSVMLSGKLLHGISHPEIGHLRIPLDDQSSAGACVFHKNCLEGLASGKSLETLYAKRPQDIDDENVWQTEAKYIALGIINIISITQPERIILGGSIMKKPGLIEQIRQNVIAFNNNYIQLPNIESYIVHASGDSIGVLGAIKLATLTN